MSFDLCDFSAGEVVYDEFHIDFSKDYLYQLDCLCEDLIQVRFGENYLLDVGWYPEFNYNGNFVIQVIQNYCWESPIYKKMCYTKESLIQNIVDAIIFLEKDELTKK